MSDEEKKPTTKFGSMRQQWETIGGNKGADMPADTMAQKRQDVKTSRDTQNMKRQTVYMPRDLAIWLKAHAALTGTDISGIMTRLVEDYKKNVE